MTVGISWCSLEKKGSRRAEDRQRLKFGTSLMEDIQGEIAVAGLVQVTSDWEKWRFMVAHVKHDLAFW